MVSQPAMLVSDPSAARTGRPRRAGALALRWTPPHPLLHGVRKMRDAQGEDLPAVDMLVLRDSASGSVVRVTRFRSAMHTAKGDAAVAASDPTVRVWHAHLHSRHRRGMCALVALLVAATLCIVGGAAAWFALVLWFAWRTAAQCADCMRGSAAEWDSDSEGGDEDVTAALICKSAGNAARRRSDGEHAAAHLAQTWRCGTAQQPVACSKA